MYVCFDVVGENTNNGEKAMNRLIILVLFAAISCSRSGEGEKTISINDLRKSGLTSKEYDKPPTGSHYSGEVIIERELDTIVDTKTDKEHVADLYGIHIYKKANNILDRFHYSAAARKDFDKASLQWIGDTANITFFNSTTNEKANMKIRIDTHGNGDSKMDSVFWGI
jgi:hypothetical protein